MELVELTLRGSSRRRTLRVDIDRPGPRGVDLEDCKRVSELLGAAIEADDDLIDGSYVLEVSSPGIDRPIRSVDDIRRNTGRRVVVTTREAAEERRSVRGLLAGQRNGILILEDEDRDDDRDTLGKRRNSAPGRGVLNGGAPLRRPTDRRQAPCYSSGRCPLRGCNTVSSELYHTIEQIGREKGLDTEVIIQALEEAYAAATRKYYRSKEDFGARFDRDTGTFHGLRASRRSSRTTTSPIPRPRSPSRRPGSSIPSVEIGDDLETPDEVDSTRR